MRISVTHCVIKDPYSTERELNAFKIDISQPAQCSQAYQSRHDLLFVNFLQVTSPGYHVIQSDVKQYRIYRSIII